MKNHWCPVLKHLAQEQNENKQTNQKIAERVNPSVNIWIPGLKKKKKRNLKILMFSHQLWIFFLIVCFFLFLEHMKK